MIDELEKMKSALERSCAGGGISGEDITDQTCIAMALKFHPTEDVATQERGGKNNQNIKDVVDHSTEAYWQTDKKFIITYTNAACEKISRGFNQGEFAGRSFLEFLTPEGIESLWQVNGLRLKNEAQGIKTDIIFHELQMKRKDGTYFWAGISASPLRDQNGEVIGYHGIMRDISVYKQYEADRKRHETLLEKVENMTAMRNMTGGVAHELNNVMAGILGYSQYLLLQEELDNKALQKHVGNIIHSGERATAIIQDLLVMARKDGTILTPVNLNELIPACLKKNEFQKLAGRYPGLAIKQDLEPSLHPVSGSLPHLNQSIMNLLSVSCEQAGPGGAVSITTRTVYLGRPINGYDGLCEGEYVVLFITDNGNGFAAEDTSHVFEPFYIRKALKKGITGLELSVVLDVIKDHNGFVDVMSKIGYGTTFTIYLPVLHGDMQDNFYRVSQVNHSDGQMSIN